VVRRAFQKKPHRAFVRDGIQERRQVRKADPRRCRKDRAKRAGGQTSTQLAQQHLLEGRLVLTQAAPPPADDAAEDGGNPLSGHGRQIPVKEPADPRLDAAGQFPVQPTQGLGGGNILEEPAVPVAPGLGLDEFGLSVWILRQRVLPLSSQVEGAIPHEVTHHAASTGCQQTVQDRLDRRLTLGVQALLSQTAPESVKVPEVHLPEPLHSHFIGLRGGRGPAPERAPVSGARRPPAPERRRVALPGVERVIRHTGQ